jgi:hypothetical protein
MEGLTMPTPDDTTRKLRLRHVNYWLHVYLSMSRSAQSPALRRAGLKRLRHFQAQARQLMTE